MLAEHVREGFERGLKLAVSKNKGDVGEGLSTQALLGGHAGTVAAIPALGAAHHSMAGREGAANPGLAERVRAQSPVPVKDGRLSAFIPKGTKLPLEPPATEDHVSLSPSANRSAGTIAHELGHVDLHRNRYGRMLQNRATMIAGAVAPGIGTMAGFASGFSDDPTVRQLGVLAPAALSVPTLAYEAGATALGLNRMRRQGASAKDLMRGLGTMAPGYGTYLARAGSGVTGALMGQRAGTFLNHDNDRTETPTPKEAGLRENFFDKVDKKDGKWEWTASVNSDGYPKIKDGEKLRLASHVALELAGRKAPTEGQVTMHRDNDLSNLHPSNLRVGTQGQNLKMMRDQGRDRPRGVHQEPDDPKYRKKEAFWEGFLRAAPLPLGQNAPT